MIYIAAAFFNEAQLNVVKAIENLLTDMGKRYYSPRHDGVLLNMSQEERRDSANRLYRLNTDNIFASDIVIGVIDGRDVGVMWELGYASGLRLMRGGKNKLVEANTAAPRIVTFTNEGFGLNIMLQESADSHCKGIVQLKRCLYSERWSDFRDFDPGMAT